MKQRQAFDDVQKRLWDAGVKTGFLYPAQLRVTHLSTDKVFIVPRDAETFAFFHANAQILFENRLFFA